MPVEQNRFGKFNEYNENIKCPLEIEIDNNIPFSDLLILSTKNETNLNCIK